MKYYRVKEESSILHTKQRMKANWIGPFSVEAGRVETRKGLSSYWMPLRKFHEMALFGELALEEAIDMA